MNQSKTCGEPCAVCDGCLEAHDAALKACIGWLEDDIGQLKNNVDELDLENDTLRARVAELEELLAEAVCYDWDAECPPKELRERIVKALVGRKGK